MQINGSTDERIISMAQKGNSVRDIADAVDVSRGAVGFFLDNLGSQRRNVLGFDAYEQELQQKGYHPSVVVAMLGPRQSNMGNHNGRAPAIPPAAVLARAAHKPSTPHPETPVGTSLDTNTLTSYRNIMRLTHEGHGIRQIVSDLGVSVADVSAAHRAEALGLLDAGATESTPVTDTDVPPNPPRPVVPAPLPVAFADNAGVTDPPQTVAPAVPPVLPMRLETSLAGNDNESGTSAPEHAPLGDARPRLNSPQSADALAAAGKSIEEIQRQLNKPRGIIETHFSELGFRYRRQSLPSSIRVLHRRGWHASVIAAALHTTVGMVASMTQQRPTSHVSGTPAASIPEIKPAVGLGRQSQPQSPSVNLPIQGQSKSAEGRPSIREQAWKLMRQGRTNREIMTRLGLDYSDVYHHRQKFNSQPARTVSARESGMPVRQVLKSTQGTETFRAAVPRAGVSSQEKQQLVPKPAPPSLPSAKKAETSIPVRQPDIQHGERLDANQARHEWIRQLGGIGTMTRWEIAQKTLTDMEEVGAVLRQAGLYVPPSNAVRSELTMIVQLADEGRSFDEVIALLGLPKARVHKMLREALISNFPGKDSIRVMLGR